MTEDPTSLDQIERLSRLEGVDVRPVLVRVVTDLFVQKPQHSADELARYEELVLQLLDVVDRDSRAAVARKLAEEPRAPRAVIARLLRDDYVVAAPLLARFPDVPRQTLLALSLDGGSVEAGAVASRRDVDGDMIRLLAHHPDDLVVEALAANRAARPDGAALAAMVARALLVPALAATLLRRDDLDAGALAPLYLQADPDRRGEIRAALARRPSRAAGARIARAHEAVDAAIAEATAAEGLGQAIADALGGALGLRPDAAAWLSAEPSGEGFLLMLRAVGVSQSAIVRALLLAQPEIALSAPRFFALIEVAETTPRSVAMELVEALAGSAARPVARREPHFDPSGAPERPAAARLAGRSRATGLEREPIRRRG